MSKKALVVDNDFFFVEFLTELLERRGYEVVKAYDGKEGVARLEEGLVDALFADLIMPKIDGRQLIQFARMKFRDNHFPIVALSGTIIEQIEKIKELGADYFIAKGPLEKMGEAINRLLDGIEGSPGAPSSEAYLIEPGVLFPRQETAELIEVLGFQKAIIDCMGVGVLVMDRDARIITVNPMALDMVRQPMEKVLNRQVTALFEEEDRPRLAAALKRVLQRKDLKGTSFHAAIDSRNLRSVVSLLRTEDKIAGFIIAMEDAGPWVEQA